MKIKEVMEVDEKLVKATDESEAKTIFNSNHRFIRPVVFSMGSAKPKIGRGWSMGEIRSAGLNRKQMRLLHLKIDKFRKAVHEDNVEILKKIKSIK